MTTTPSILMVAGRQHYTLSEFIDEAKAHGVSKRIPLQSVPEGLVFGVSKIFIAHPCAIVKVTADGKSLADLAYELLELEMMTPTQWANLVDLDMPYWTGKELLPGDPVPESMLDIAYALSKVKGPRYNELVKKYGLEFCMGVIGWAPFQGIQLVLPDGKEDIPTDIQSEIGHMLDNGYVEPVHIKYVGGDGEEDGGLL